MSEPPLAEEFLPVWDVSDSVATVIEADRESACRALLDVDLLKVGREAPMLGVLGAPKVCAPGRCLASRSARGFRSTRPAPKKIAADDSKERTMSDQRQQQETGQERQEPKDSNDERVPAPTQAIEDLEAAEQAEDVKGGFMFM